MEKKIDAQALPLVLAVSVLMLLGIMTAWSGVDLLSRSNRRYHSQRQREADLVSVLALMHRDSTARDSVRVPSGKSGPAPRQISHSLHRWCHKSGWNAFRQHRRYRVKRTFR